MRPTSSPTAWAMERAAWPRTRPGARPTSTASCAWSSGTRTTRRSSSGPWATKPGTGSTSKTRMPGSSGATLHGPSSTSRPGSAPTPTSTAPCTHPSRRSKRTPQRRPPGRSSCASMPTPWATRRETSRITGTSSKSTMPCRAGSSGTGSTRALPRKTTGGNPSGPLAATTGRPIFRVTPTSAATASWPRTAPRIPDFLKSKKSINTSSSRPWTSRQGLIEVANRYDFIPLDGFNLRWEVTADGRPIKTGVIESPAAGPHRSVALSIPLPKIKARPGTEYFLNVIAETRKDAPGVPKGHAAAAEQFKLPWSSGAGVPPVAAKADLSVEDGPRVAIIGGSGFAVLFDKLTGTLASFTFQGRELIESGPEPNFWRAPTDNDFGNRMNERLAVWRQASLEREIKSLTVARDAPDRVTVTVVFDLVGVAGVPYRPLYDFRQRRGPHRQRFHPAR